MKNEISGIIKNLSLSVFIIFFSTGCMMMGMKMAGSMMGTKGLAPSDLKRTVNTGKAVDKMIDEAVSDLSEHDPDINSVAVWLIKSQTAGLNVELIRQKLITKLVSLDRYKVISRQRLDELLDEQNLSVSGAIDEKSAVEFGNLTGVEGFIDGYASIENNRFTLSLTLIESKTGVIVWAKTVERPVKL